MYDGVQEEELTREDYLQEEQKYLNTDVFLPKDTSPYITYFTSNYNYNPYITTPVTLIGYLNPPQFVIPELRRQNANLQPDYLTMSNNVSIQRIQPKTSTHANLSGLTRLPIRDGCTATPIFWEDCNATSRCEDYLANHIDSYTQRLNGLPKRTFSTRSHSPSSTTTERATYKRIPQNVLPPWRHLNFLLTPTNMPVQKAYQVHIATNAANGANYARRLLWQYIHWQTGGLV